MLNNGDSLNNKNKNDLVVSQDSSLIESIPGILPVLPLRDIVIFPYMIFPVLVGREQSIKAANVALEETKYIRQVRRYIQHIQEIGYENVSGYVFYVKSGKIVECPLPG